jgi:N-hydroxyarylamine O-acetyltransferase
MPDRLPEAGSRVPQRLRTENPMSRVPPLNLEAYLDRIRYAGSLRAGFEELEMLHNAHSEIIPFENLDVMLGRPIGLDLETLQRKLVESHRGGYCFEHNTLFAAALRMLGFTVSTLEARVRLPNSDEIRPRTHMILRVDLDGRAWLADVGFGGDGPFSPVPMDGVASEQGAGAYRVISVGMDCVLQTRWQEVWRDLYVFVLRPVHPIDYEVANHYTSTHPWSHFVRTFTAQIKTPTARHILRGRTYSVGYKDRAESAELSEESIVRLIHERFGLRVNDDEIVRALSLSR